MLHLSELKKRESLVFSYHIEKAMKRRVILLTTRDATLFCFKFTESLCMLEADNLDKMKQGSEPHTDR